jgi:hypothetical protein
MNLPSFPDLKAKTRQAALKSPRTWVAPLLILLLFFSERCPLPEAAALLFVSTLVQLTVWYNTWHAFEERTCLRLLRKHTSQFESVLAKENEKNPTRVLKRALKSFQTISASICQNENLSETEIRIQQGMEDQIRAITQILSETKHRELDDATEGTVENSLRTLEKLATIRAKTQNLKQKQGIAEEIEHSETPVETLKRVSDNLQHQTEIEEEMQKLIMRVQETPETNQTESSTPRRTPESFNK